MKQLACQKKLSVSTVRRIIHYWLSRPPAQARRPLDQATKYLILDGTFLDRRTGIYAIMNAETFRLLKGYYNVQEGSRDLPRIYAELSNEGLKPSVATVDGNPQQIKYLRAVWGPHVTIQRCMVHVVRQGLQWLRRNPKRMDARELKEIFLELQTVTTSTGRDQFLEHFRLWEERYGNGIEAEIARRRHKGSSGWVFSDLVRARSMLLNALPNLFHYIDNAMVAFSTNALEGYFGFMKERYRRHRGMSEQHRKAYFLWFFHLYNLDR